MLALHPAPAVCRTHTVDGVIQRVILEQGAVCWGNGRERFLAISVTAAASGSLKRAQVRQAAFYCSIYEFLDSDVSSISNQ